MITVELIQDINYLVSIGGVVGILVIGILLFDLFTKRSLENKVKKFGAYVMFLVSLGAILLSLVYSEIFGILPCGFCWFERIFLYPQALIVLVGLYIKDMQMPKYTLVLSTIGFLIALYHHYIQMGGSQFIACPTGGAGVDCANRFLFEFGFMTFPLLAVIGFGLIGVISLYLIKISSVQKVD